MLDEIIGSVRRRLRKRPPPAPVTWTREEVVAAMLEYIIPICEETLELALLKNFPDYERVRDTGYYIGLGPEPAREESDEPLTESNSYVVSYMSFKRAYIMDWSGDQRLHVWLWNESGLHPLEPESWSKEKEDPNLEYTLYVFVISDDLRKVSFACSTGEMASRGWSLLVTKSDERLKMADNPEGGFWMS